MLLRLAERHPNDVRTGILHTIYGIGQEAQGQRMKFPTAAATKALKARQTGKVEMWGNGQQMRSYLYIDDAIRKITTVMEADIYEGAVNIGYEGAVTCNYIQQVCLDIVNYLDADIEYNLQEPSGVLARDCDNSKFSSLYGFQKDMGYSKGFSKLLNWLDKSWL
jgi:nucleoside-diphosphate-sugar epimerase